jgi:hypothetical protein
VAKGATARAGTAAMAAPVNIFAPCALPSRDERETGVLSRRSSRPRAGRRALRQCALTSPPSRFGHGRSLSDGGALSAESRRRVKLEPLDRRS